MRLILLFSLLITTTSLSAQKMNKYLSGQWKGYITLGSLEATSGQPFELFLEVKGTKIKGRTLIHLEDGDVLEMNVKGQLYSDHSLRLQELEFVQTEGFDAIPTHYKKYQFIHHRSIFESDNKLDGYWQEIMDTPFGKKRRRGRIVLQKVVPKKA
ncbi:MAG: hypothetical protein AAGI23_06710 [Bacteroidota bacterium]